MGLDQYAGTMREKVYEYTTPQGEKKEEKYQMAGPFEWRKHARLQEFMNKLYMEKNKINEKWEQSGPDSNGEYWVSPISWNQIELLEDDIDKLEEAINNGYCRYFCDGGFFWGHEFQEEAAKDYKEKDLEFVEFAREALADGETVIYECSW
jgi:hypothetical protein